jgi:hypothetical protein
MSSLLNIEIKSVIVVSCIGVIVGLRFFMETANVLGIENSTDNNCIDIDCLKELIERMCIVGKAPLYLDCENILRCIDAREQEIMSECVKRYPADNESRSCNSQDLLYRSWCEYTRGAIPK